MVILELFLVYVVVRTIVYYIRRTFVGRIILTALRLIKKDIKTVLRLCGPRHKRKAQQCEAGKVIYLRRA